MISYKMVVNALNKMLNFTDLKLFSDIRYIH